MAYNQNIPNASDFLSDSQGQLKENFQQLQTQFSKNHVPLSPNSSNNGRHTFVEMRNVTGSQEIPPTPSSTPLAASLATAQGTLYTLLGTFGSDLYYVSNNNTTRTYKLTTVTNISGRYNQLGTINPVVTTGITDNVGWTSLCNGVIMMYGFSTSQGASPQAVTFAFPFTAVPFSVQVTPVASVPASGADIANRIAILDGSISASGFQIKRTSSSELASFQWLAIGPSNG